MPTPTWADVPSLPVKATIKDGHKTTIVIDQHFVSSTQKPHRPSVTITATGKPSDRRPGRQS